MHPLIPASFEVGFSARAHDRLTPGKKRGRGDGDGVQEDGDVKECVRICTYKIEYFVAGVEGGDGDGEGSCGG